MSSISLVSSPAVAPAPPTAEHEGKITISRSYSPPWAALGGLPPLPEDNEQRLFVHVFATEPAHAEASAGLTLKLAQDFEFCRFDCKVQAPCYVEELDRALAWVWSKVESEIAREARAIREKIGRSR